jgi:hypothetical protein
MAFTSIWRVLSSTLCRQEYTRKQEARTAAFAVRAFSVEMIPVVPYSVALSKPRRRFTFRLPFFYRRGPAQAAGEIRSTG